ncbi:sulfotransferase domain-containing protein [Mesorhizobium sp. NZP2077]|uniref:sulfotransferase domain-containing protein n=1 Tax=Mesorhizobium sp. NZP2077 TaxID=2483404 RepID=UPI001556C327|nr:sulfotransferase domain-containing protein [Mesorhizobium sp. NZP2077]QKC82047.1 sulfotransferase domain-containing protein [Mesorhizobium sp. NZP2077]QKD15518.1 sulfotransferase domain-containing protein [Mesorhizobium sp. NZP2077]
MTANVQMPVKSRDIHNHHMNSTTWDNFKFRDDDIILATYAKSGTTWTQQILAQLIFNGAEGIEISKLSPWYDLRIMPPEALAALEGQTHRRFVKTHLPVDALVFSPKAKYLYVARDGRDMVWSLYNHHLNANEHWYGALNNTPGRVGPPIDPPPGDIAKYFRDWLEKDGYPFWSFWENVRSWWEIRDLPNVKLLHFNDLKRDLPGTIRRIAGFLDIGIDDSAFPAIVEHCTFDYMKSHAESVTPLGGMLWEGGAQTFIHKGTNGRWKGVLTSADISAYELTAERELGRECAQWLERGKQT